jgi:hypothetical protein
LGVTVKIRIGIVAGAAVAAALSLATASASATACESTGWEYKGVPMTASLVNPGDLIDASIDAGGCDIAVFYDAGETGSVLRSEISNAKYFGIVMFGAEVSVTESEIHQIGDDPFTGAQHGVGIYCASDSPQTSGGDITANYVHHFQKNGIVVTGANCGGESGVRRIRIVENVVQGGGPIDYIAQNGIQVGLGAAYVLVKSNKISGFSYTGENFASSGGILIYGGSYYGSPLTKKIHVLLNQIAGSDVGIYDVNCETDCSPPSERTTNVVNGNVIAMPVFINKTGNGSGGYQAGLSIVGRGGKYKKNDICGNGYWGSTSSRDDFKAVIDFTGTKLKILGNFCSETGKTYGDPISDSAENAMAGASSDPGMMQPFE